ncbi:MAG: RNA methyltransferase [Lentisphaeria bacterium]
MPDPSPRFHPLTGDRAAAPETPRLPLVLVLDRLRSAHNVGNLFRLAEAVRASGVWTCGYTATPPHPKLEKTARGCDRLVPCRHFADTPAALRELRSQGWRLYAVDTVREARWSWDTVFHFPAALVLGNEALGISPEALELCDEAIALPCLGQKNSVNVGNCAAVPLYEALRQWLQATPGLRP